MGKQGEAEEKGVLGHDPFDGLDISWLEEADDTEETAPVEVLGHDPFEDLEEDWVEKYIPPEVEPIVPTIRAEEIETAAPVMAEAGLEAVFTEEAVSAVPAPPPVRPSPPPPAQPASPVQPTPPVQPAVPLPPLVTSTARATFHFPADFLWGVATSSHQVEGDNTNNDWWAWEQEPGHIQDGQVSGRACDWWANAEADFERAAALGLNTLRLSIEWSRVEPRPGVFDEHALARYAQMLHGLRERGMEPLVTLHHFTNPRWLAEQGGWAAPTTVGLFARYVRKVVESLGRFCNFWCTVNEPNVYAVSGYLNGEFPPGERDARLAMRVLRNLLAGHAAAYREIHARQPNARVGLAHNLRIFDPANPRSPLDRRVTRWVDRAYNQALVTALTKGVWMWPLGFGLAWKLRRSLDWIGLNYYTRDLVAFDRRSPQTLFSRRTHAEGAELLDGGYGEFYPQGIFRALQRLSRLGLPIYITENGIPDADDDQRPRYLLTHLHQVWHAIQFAYPVMGYYHWTLVDNFEWARGWTLRFGLIGLDPATQARQPRRSASLYADIIRSNAITPPIIETYAPELRPVLLPGGL